MSRAAVIVTLGAVVLVASLWLPRLEAESFEDFYGTYGGRLGIPEEMPEDRELPALPDWFFPGLDAPPFERLAGTWIAAAATALTAAGLAVLAREARSAVHDGH